MMIVISNRVPRNLPSHLPREFPLQLPKLERDLAVLSPILGICLPRNRRTRKKLLPRMKAPRDLTLLKKLTEYINKSSEFFIFIIDIYVDVDVVYDFLKYMFFD
jgi:hypothetical protein